MAPVNTEDENAGVSRLPNYSLIKLTLVCSVEVHMVPAASLR